MGKIAITRTPFAIRSANHSVDHGWQSKGVCSSDDEGEGLEQHHLLLVWGNCGSNIGHDVGNAAIMGIDER